MNSKKKSEIAIVTGERSVSSSSKLPQVFSLIFFFFPLISLSKE